MVGHVLVEVGGRKFAVSPHEGMALMGAMALGLHESSIDGFYHLCRTLCVKDIALYDAYDEAFLAYFKDVHTDALQLTEQLRSLADSGDKDAQFTYSVLLLTGRCVPQDICAARKYREQSHGSATDWGKTYPIPREFEKKEAETVCN